MASMAELALRQHGSLERAAGNNGQEIDVSTVTQAADAAIEDCELRIYVSLVQPLI